MSKKVRKLRAMTYKEFCQSQDFCFFCPFRVWNNSTLLCECGERKMGNGYDNEPCRLPNGKYIFLEVKE